MMTWPTYHVYLPRVVLPGADVAVASTASPPHAQALHLSSFIVAVGKHARVTFHGVHREPRADGRGLNQRAHSSA